MSKILITMIAVAAMSAAGVLGFTAPTPGATEAIVAACVCCDCEGSCACDECACCECGDDCACDSGGCCDEACGDTACECDDCSCADCGDGCDSCSSCCDAAAPATCCQG